MGGSIGMIYISDYELKPRKKDGRLHVVNRGTEPVCPKCGRILQYRDERSRVYKREVGERNVLYVRRLYCRYCKTYHVELPDFLEKNRQYTV